MAKSSIAIPTDDDGAAVELDGGITAEIVLYQAGDANVPVEVRYLDETFWLTQREMAELFDVDRTVITKHLKNVFQEGELDRAATSANIALVRTEGARKVRRKVEMYNLDAIIAVGYRVNSLKATRFRQWATRTLKDYITKGFVLNDDMLKNGAPFGQDYFDELLARIRDIRASERRVWQKVTDTFQECSFDYDRDSDVARGFSTSSRREVSTARSPRSSRALRR